jgi:hypothetical protein
VAGSGILGGTMQILLLFLVGKSSGAVVAFLAACKDYHHHSQKDAGADRSLVVAN